jgi:MoaA/NifB/PqqE/SkfB family radical SAM enzyme
MGEGGRIDLDDADGDFKPRSSPRDSVDPRKMKCRIKVNEDGSVSMPAVLAGRLGVEPGAELEIAADGGRVEIQANIHSLARVYIEPTTRCNLACGMCIRNSWQEPAGDMDASVFQRLASQLRRFPHLDAVIFGGFGEPTAHPEILTMIRSAKEAGPRIEMVTNGTMLDETMIAGLMAAGLDRLWISLEGTAGGGADDTGHGAGYETIKANLRILRKMNGRSAHSIEVGIAFVAMKSNLEELGKLEGLIRAADARCVSISNVLPYSREMEAEMICNLGLTLETFTGAPGPAEISLPRIDLNERTKDILYNLLRSGDRLTLMGNPVGVPAESCRFIRDRCTFIRWDGKVSPCMGLLHTHRTYLFGLERNVSAHSLGDVISRNLHEIWNSEEYTRFRERIREFNFPPCHACGGCSLLESNSEDCNGNAFPTCGGCLWARGVIQCP